jgi:hypothetical protein
LNVSPRPASFIRKIDMNWPLNADMNDWPLQRGRPEGIVEKIAVQQVMRPRIIHFGAGRGGRGGNKMTIWNHAALRLATAVLFAVIAASGSLRPGSAEASDNPTRAVRATDAHASSVKPAAKAQRVPPTANRNAQARPWSIEDALPARSSALNNSTPAPTTNTLGQIPLRNGTLGVATESQLNPYDTPEARRLRGLENTNHSGPSYLGLSLSVPTSDKLFPMPTPSQDQPQ